MYMCMKSIKLIRRTSIITIFILLFIVSDCAISPKIATIIYHDKTNPCTKGNFQNFKECDKWKKNHPREYKRYLERIKTEPKSN
jgi:hypothetical protein